MADDLMAFLVVHDGHQRIERMQENEIHHVRFAILYLFPTDQLDEQILLSPN